MASKATWPCAAGTTEEKPASGLRSPFHRPHARSERQDFSYPSSARRHARRTTASTHGTFGTSRAIGHRRRTSVRARGERLPDRDRRRPRSSRNPRGGPSQQARPLTNAFEARLLDRRSEGTPHRDVFASTSGGSEPSSPPLRDGSYFLGPLSTLMAYAST